MPGITWGQILLFKTMHTFCIVCLNLNTCAFFMEEFHRLLVWLELNFSIEIPVDCEKGKRKCCFLYDNVNVCRFARVREIKRLLSLRWSKWWNTASLELGDLFSDGCNENCTCTKTRKNRGPWSCETDKKCSCKYQNWDQVVGYANSGESVPVYDKKGDRMFGSKYGCPKYCTCRTKRSGKMKLDCKKEPCIAF